MVATDLVEPGLAETIVDKLIVVVVVVQDLLQLLPAAFDPQPLKRVPIYLANVIKPQTRLLDEVPSSTSFLGSWLKDHQLFHISIFDESKAFVGIMSEYLVVERVVELEEVIMAMSPMGHVVVGKDHQTIILGDAHSPETFGIGGCHLVPDNARQRCIGSFNFVA